MQPQADNTIPMDVRYVFTPVEVEALALMCTKYAEAEIEEGLQNGISKVEILKKVDEQVHRIIQQKLQSKADAKEVTTFTSSLLDARVQMFSVDPINEVLSLHYELMFIRYLFNELVISDEKFKEIINDDCFVKARTFAAGEMKNKFPLVQQNIIPPTSNPEPANELEKSDKE